LELDGGDLALFQRLDLPYTRPSVQPPYYPHLALETLDIEGVPGMAARKHLRAAAGVFETAGEAKGIYLCDPDNNIIEFMEWVSKKIERRGIGGVSIRKPYGIPPANNLGREKAAGQESGGFFAPEILRCFPVPMEGGGEAKSP
jgi:hypothetical protein